jgi:hypothetical protein
MLFIYLWIVSNIILLLILAIYRNTLKVKDEKIKSKKDLSIIILYINLIIFLVVFILYIFSVLGSELSWVNLFKKPILKSWVP